jgi:hypothetical protein
VHDPKFRTTSQIILHLIEPKALTLQDTVPNGRRRTPELTPPDYPNPCSAQKRGCTNERSFRCGFPRASYKDRRAARPIAEQAI